MKRVKLFIVALLSMATFVACHSENSPVLMLDRTSLYFPAWGSSSQVIYYTSTDTDNVEVSSVSDGWSAVVDMASHRIIVTPRGSEDEEVPNEELSKEGILIINAYNSAGDSATYYIYLYITEIQTLDKVGRANCYIITKPAISYAFDVKHRPDGTALNTESVKLLWQSNPSIINNVDLVLDKAIFYIPALADDENRLEDTNAVIAAYNGAGEVIWSWHLWITNENPLEATDTYSNGKTFMRQNLGAFTNSNGVKDTQKIYDSYGMYYQWGRKDPFPRPYYFDASGAEDESRISMSDGIIQEVYNERTSQNGTLDYITKNPMHYICNSEHSEYAGDSGNGVGDWLTVSDNTLWGGATKSVYDPSPYGWRVPTAEEMAVLFLADAEDNTPLDEARGQYGWHLTDGTSSFFYPACGRRRYNDGKVENINYKEGVYPSQPQPWEGHYWTSSTTADGKAISLYFDLTTTRTINKFVGQQPRFRANGFQIRCVKE